MNLFLCRVAEDVYPLTPPGRPEVLVPEGEQSSDYTVSWSHNDAVSPAVEYELIERQFPQTFTDSGNTLDYWRCLGGGGWRGGRGGLGLRLGASRERNRKR